MLWSVVRVIFKTSSVTPDFFYVFNLVLSFSTCSQSFNKICVWEVLGANVLKFGEPTSLIFFYNITFFWLYPPIGFWFYESLSIIIWFTFITIFSLFLKCFCNAVTLFYGHANCNCRCCCWYCVTVKRSIPSCPHKAKAIYNLWLFYR